MAGEDGGEAEYASARKLVLRAANREAILISNDGGASRQEGGKMDALSSGAAGGGDAFGSGADFSSMPLKPDHVARPCWVCPDGHIFLEAFHELYISAYDFLVAVAEPVARPEFLHEYKLTPYSLYAAVATNIDTESIVRVLSRLSKNELPDSVATFVRECTKRYGKAKLVLKSNKFYVESEHPSVLRELLRDPEISRARVSEDVSAAAAGGGGGEKDVDGFVVSTKAEEMDENLKMLREPDDDDSDDEELDLEGRPVNKPSATPALTTVSFQVKGEMVETVKRQAIELDYPLMEEYDFRNDRVNADLPMDLKPHTRIRRYQERSLAKMFGNGRARSGIIVLPCGAGKTLTGVTAAQTIKKSVVCLCTNAVSVLQWKYQFKLWTNIPEERISCFTSDKKDPIHPDGCLLITTYTMISYGGRRSAQSAEVMNAIQSREWGLMLMDEVHVVPAKMFRRVVGSVKAHCRLGLTATLVREDDLISDLNFLIGPKLYEANWMDLTAQGYLANVQCVEAWCPMTAPFMTEYLSAANSRLKQLLYVMNPSKLRAVEFLVRFHEERGDKIIVFSDLVYSLKMYADMLKRPLIYGETPERERQAILGTFRSTE
jgi:DNA excision repair protein ERCC-3